MMHIFAAYIELRGIFAGFVEHKLEIRLMTCLYVLIPIRYL